MSELRPGLQPVPRFMQDLPLEERGYPVPYFADTNPATGKRELRAADPHKILKCVQEQLCWVCGHPLDSFLERGPRVFVIGPMCSVNRISSEPPSHPVCARYSVQNCPFLSKPKMVRNYAGFEKREAPAGQLIERNPGVTLLWWANGYELIRTGNGIGFLFHFTSRPKMVEWWTEGRKATREEVLASIESGLPIIRAEAEKEGPAALTEYAVGVKRSRELLPR